MEVFLFIGIVVLGALGIVVLLPIIRGRRE